jgi:cytoskeletal protein RodZ
MNKKQIIPVVIAVAVLAVSSYFYFQNQEAKKVEEQKQAETSSNTQSQQSTENSTTTEDQTTPPATKLSYAEAMKKYPNRIQFKNCSGIPGKISIKRGVLIMLDNRDPKAHTIVIKSQSVRIPAYDYALVPATVLGTYNITCDGGGAAEINVKV